MGAVEPSPGSELQALGVPSDAEALWRVLLTRRDWDITAVSELSALSPAQCRAQLDGLVDLGLVQTDGAGRYAATEPSLALETLAVRAEGELIARTAAIASARLLGASLSNAFTQVRTAAGDMTALQVIKPLREIRRQIALTIERTTYDVRSLDPGLPTRKAELEAFEEGRDSQSDMLSRGIRDRTIAAESVIADHLVFEQTEEIHAKGALVRLLPSVPCRMTIFDSAVALIAIDPRDGNVGALMIRVPSIIDTLIFMFDQMWSTAVPVFSVPTGDGTPSRRAARVIELMAAGMKDDRIARVLNVGPRTVGRDIAELKVSLGVSSRAEIVAAAARRGWV